MFYNTARNVIVTSAIFLWQFITYFMDGWYIGLLFLRVLVLAHLGCSGQTALNAGCCSSTIVVVIFIFNETRLSY